MYAIVSLAGKQTVLELGAIIDTDAIEAEVGSTLDIQDVLCFHDGKAAQFGTPKLEKFSIKAKVVGHGKDKKIRVVHFKRRQNHLKWQGSRAQFTKLQIVEIAGPGVKEKFVEPKAEKKADEKTPEKAPAVKAKAAAAKPKAAPKKAEKPAEKDKAASKKPAAEKQPSAKKTQTKAKK